MRTIYIARNFFYSIFPITRIIATLTPDARMFSQLHILTILKQLRPHKKIYNVLNYHVY